jgi:hypothetical protein
MFEVFLWVPSKGWKSLLRTRIFAKAYARAHEFLPLEIKLSCPDGRSLPGGNTHVPCDTPSWEEAMGDSLDS